MSQIKIRRRDYFLFTCCVIFWLIPISYVGTLNKPVSSAPNFCNNLYYVACLFPRRIGSWSEHFAQVQLSGGTVWIDVPNQLISQMQPFGHRNRTHRMIGKAKRTSGHSSITKKNWLLRQQLAEYIKKKFEKFSNDDIEVIRVRFLSVTMRSSDAMAGETQRWINLPRTALRLLRPKARERVISVHAVSGDIPRRVQR